MTRTFDPRTAALEVLMVLDKNRVPACAVDEVFTLVKQEMTSLPVTIGHTGFSPEETTRRCANARREFAHWKNRRMT